MADGETIFIEDAGYFTVSGPPPTEQTALVLYQNITANTNAGNPVTSGAKVTPSAVANNGQDGLDATTVTTANFTVPGKGNPTVPPIVVANSDWATIGQNVFIEGAGYFLLTAKPDSQHMTLTYLNIAANTNAGLLIGAGAQISPAGPSQLTGALPTAITDNSTGTQSNTIAAGAGVQTLAFYIEAATIANGDLLTDYVPGFKFKILKFDARCSKPVTTGAKAATLNLEINSTNITGGVISLAGTYVLGAAQAGTAVTALNTGSATDAFSIEASAVTPFTEGAFWLIIELQNMDTADAAASLAKHVNDLITALS